MCEAAKSTGSAHPSAFPIGSPTTRHGNNASAGAPERTSRSCGSGVPARPSRFRCLNSAAGIKPARPPPRERQFTTNQSSSPVSPARVVVSQAKDELRDRRVCGWPSAGTSACAVVPCSGDESAMPGQDRRGLDREDCVPAASGEQRGQPGEPETICWLVTDLAGDLATEDGILVLEHEQLCVLGGVTAQHHRWNGQQSSGQSVQQRHSHWTMVSTATPGLLTWCDGFSSGTGAPAGEFDQQNTGPGASLSAVYPVCPGRLGSWWRAGRVFRRSGRTSLGNPRRGGRTGGLRARSTTYEPSRLRSGPPMRAHRA